jgi:hypothetical protein
MKRGQITTFIILGIILITSIAIFLVIFRAEEEIPLTVLNIDPINVYVERCIENTAVEGIYVIGAQGGFNILSKPETEYIDVPYYLYYGNNRMPPLEIIESEYSRYIEDTLDLCLDNFSAFKDQGYDFMTGEIDVTSSFSKDRITIDVNYPIDISLGRNTATTDRFQQEVDFDFVSKYDMMQRIMSSLEQSPNAIPMVTMMTEVVENNAMFEIVEIDTNNVVFPFVFDETIRPGQRFVYAFMARYNWEHFVDTSREVDILPIRNLIVNEGDIINIDVEATGTNVSFSDFSDLFDITPLGKISFVAEKGLAGKHSVIITASNEYDSDIEIFDIIIVPKGAAPVIDPIPDQALELGQTLTYQISAQDPDGDVIKYYSVLDIPGLDVNSTSGLLTFTPQYEGTFNISVIAVDASAQFGKTSFEVEVTR